MKTNIFKSSFLALAMMASFSACTQNEEFGTPAPADEDILNVVAYSNNFVSTDAASRITDNGTTTTFTDGDAIGVFIVRDGEALVSNMKMTLNSNKWVGDANAPLYYYKNADYIAYYPYTANLAVTTVDEIVEYFTSKISVTGQTSLADYRNADLMTAEVPAESVVRGQNITFKFAHKMAMLEVKAPVRSYTTSTTYSGEAFTYKAPLGLKVVNGSQELSLCNVGTDETSGKDIFRCILVPSATEMTIQGQFQDGNVEVYFPAVGQEVKYTPAAGTYQGINIAYTYDYGTTGSTRDLKVGDYYYSDGSIYPGDLTGAPKDGCVGIIFSTTTSTTDQGLGWSHGYVVSLFDTDANKHSWSALDEDIVNLKLYEKTIASFTEAFADYDGYSATQAVLATTNYSSTNYAAVSSAVNYSKIIPNTTSGWYLPSIGQVALIINELGAKKGTEPSNLFAPENAMDGLSGGTGKFDENRGAPEAMKALEETLGKVGGKFDYNTTGSYRWWTSSGVNSDNTKAWAIDTNFAKFLLYDADKTTDGNMYVRPVFAF